ncbi:MAG TPA: GNAT family N-acetyltransferase [Candidatus Binatia bacterium]|nr:GNAT family N-acetyltransferase [Candidatus Binatia bacterium]
MPVVIARERPDAPEAAALVEELEAHLASIYALESRHGLSVERLVREQVAFFVARDDGVPAGCGGVQLFGREYAELKRMYVRPPFRGRGLGRQILARLTGYAREHGMPLLRLETGVHQHEAIALYEASGFRRIPPFGPYRDDPVSRCYERDLRAE